jgi:Niemann-Pick C1 protein
MKFTFIPLSIFSRLGYNVAKNPLKTILMAWMFAALCAIGFLNFKQEKEPMRLWVPEDSKFLINAKTIMDKFGEGIRRETVLLVSKTNVLTPEVMDKLLTLNEVIKNITFIGENDDELTFDDVCFK